MSNVRSTLSMATYKALPDRFASVDDVVQAEVRHLVHRHDDAGRLQRTDLVLRQHHPGLRVQRDHIAIITYYSVKFGDRLRAVLLGHRVRIWRTAWGQVILPSLAALILIPAGVFEAYQMAQPNTSGASLAGVGVVFIIGVASLLFGVLLICGTSSAGLLPQPNSPNANARKE